VSPPPQELAQEVEHREPNGPQYERNEHATNGAINTLPDVRCRTCAAGR
jgi:hypothetical protein